MDHTRRFFEAAPTTSSWAARSYRALLAHYYNLSIPPNTSVLEIGCGAGELLALIRARRKAGIDLSAHQIEAARARVPEAEFHVQAGAKLVLSGKYDYIIVSETLNFAGDAQQLLERIHSVCHADSRLVFNYYSALWRPVLQAARWLGLRGPQPQSSWINTADIRNFLSLAGWQLLAIQPRILVPVQVPLLAALCNRWIAPLSTWFCITTFGVARRAPMAPPARTVSVVIPARNEAGNIEAAVLRTPELGAGTEIIFVEGNSTDHTWAEIQRVAAAHPERRIKIMQQPGRGKGDAVRTGFAAATGDILMILDADLTMPPEELPKFYEVLARGQADFANGCRLVYPMDEEAMQFLNLCANRAFGIIFTWLLGQPVKDTLCGTKVLTRAHYEEIAANRGYFGDFDPFGDFDLLFGAAKLNLRIVDVPIRYKERTYGTTNIQRWKHGWLLLRMVLFAARKLKFV
ncbi:MAG: glycosyl transferase [Opitutus sp.]|nr:glycosyl transferase [Opitutus sp.]